jgi:hypothetical protein
MSVHLDHLRDGYLPVAAAGSSAPAAGLGGVELEFSGATVAGRGGLSPLAGWRN